MSTLFTKKTKIEVGKWGYRGFVITKNDKQWDVTDGDDKLKNQINSDKTVKAVCVQIDNLLGCNVTSNDNSTTKEIKKSVKKADTSKTDLRNILSSSFAKTRKTKITYDESGKARKISFEILALDGIIKYKPIRLDFESDLVKSKRLELIELTDSASSFEIIERQRLCKTYLNEISQEKQKLNNIYKGLELMKKRSTLDEKYWIPITFDIAYIKNE